MPQHTTRVRPGAALLAVVVALAGCDADPPAAPELPENRFQRQMEKPDWLDDVDAPRVATADEVSALWRSKKRCCIAERKLRANNREFYKACYLAIGEHFDDEELVVKCLWLMTSGAEGDQRRQIRQYLVDHHFEYRGRTDNCANCAPADTVARVSRSLALDRLAAGRAQEASAVIERVLDERLDETSPWVQVELYESLARAYLELEATEARAARLQTAYERLRAMAATDEPVARRMDRFEAAYREASERAGQTDLSN